MPNRPGHSPLEAVVLAGVLKQWAPTFHLVFCTEDVFPSRVDPLVWRIQLTGRPAQQASWRRWASAENAESVPQKSSGWGHSACVGALGTLDNFHLLPPFLVIVVSFVGRPQATLLLTLNCRGFFYTIPITTAPNRQNGQILGPLRHPHQRLLPGQPPLR